MKIRKLYFNGSLFVGDTVRTVDEKTHDIADAGAFYLLRHHRSGLVYRVHASQAVAEVDVSEEDVDAPAEAAARAPGRRGAASQKPAAVPGG